MEAMTFREFSDQMMRFYTNGKYANALQLVEQNAGYFPEQSVLTTFWKMCLLSLCNRPDDVMSVFRQGLDQGLWWGITQFQDSDLNAVRELPEFKHLMTLSQEKYEKARAQIQRDHALLLPEPPASGRYPLIITLHGHSGNKSSNLKDWEAARERNWLVLCVQSTQPLFSGAYSWDDPVVGLADLNFYYEQISRQYPIDPQRVIIAGFSQGSGMAIYAAIKGNLPVRGFIGIGTWWPDTGIFTDKRKELRGYFIIGEKDHTLGQTRAIQDTLRRSDVQIAEELHPDLGHAFPADFAQSFDKAIDFIFKEPE
jgi:dienelactone hydrolase